MSLERVGDDNRSTVITSVSKHKLYHDATISRPVYKLPPTHSEVEKLFNNLDSKSNNGKITAKDLQRAFEIFQGKHFSDSSCKFVVRLFDLDKNGGLDIQEFEHLYSYIKDWVKSFNLYDRNRTGYLDEKELELALKELALQFTPEFIRFLISRNDPVGRRISLDQYITTCVQIQKFSDEFIKLDEHRTGSIVLKYEDFLEMVMKCI